MSQTDFEDQAYDDIDGDDTDDETPQPQQDKKESRAAVQARKARLEAAAAKRELAFLKAGVDTDSKIGKLLLNSYDGDLSADAIKSFAADIPGALPSQASTPDAEAAADAEAKAPEYSDEEKAQTRERQALAQGGLPDDGSGIDPYAQAQQVRADLIKRGVRGEAALAAAFDHLAEASMRGDTRVNYHGPAGLPE